MGLYYLQSRYYDPEVGRFLNADALISTGQGVLGNNMFAYCRNNPVSRVDFSGTWDVDCFDSDGNPITDEKEMWGRSSTGGGTGTPSAGQNNSGGSKGGLSGGQNGGGTPIYRYGGISKNNLVPTARDVAAKTKNGLSFSTKWKPGAAMTTVESVNATGMFVANIDDSCHVTVYPIGITVSEWHDQGIDSPWTQALAQIVSLS